MSKQSKIKISVANTITNRLNIIDLIIPYVTELLNLYFEELIGHKLELKDIDILYLTKIIKNFYTYYKNYLQDVNDYIKSEGYKDDDDENKFENISMFYSDYLSFTNGDMFFELNPLFKIFIKIYDNSFYKKKLDFSIDSESKLAQLNFKYWKLLLEKYDQTRNNTIKNINNNFSKYLINDLVQIINVKEIIQ